MMMTEIKVITTHGKDTSPRYQLACRILLLVGEQVGDQWDFFMGKANHPPRILHMTLNKKMRVGSLKYCCEASYARFKLTPLLVFSVGLITRLH